MDAQTENGRKAIFISNQILKKNCQFLDAAAHLYKRVRSFVGPSDFCKSPAVAASVGRVSGLVFLLTATRMTK